MPPLVYCFIAYGITGSGKDHFAKTVLPGLPGEPEMISTDMIREEIYGTREQYQSNDGIYPLMMSRVREMLKMRKSVYVNATNVLQERWVDYETMFLDFPRVRFYIVNFEYDSMHEGICEARVKTDIDAGKNRTNTLREENGISIIEKQRRQMRETLDYVKGLPKRFANLAIIQI